MDMPPSITVSSVWMFTRPRSSRSSHQVNSYRFDRDVLSALKANGHGWQTRGNDAMREWIKTHSAD